MLSPLFYTLWLVLGSLSIILIFFLFVFFGKLMWLQFRVWLLAKRGYHQVEHIGLNKVRTYYYLRPRDNKFDFKDGFYLHIPETVTKTDSILSKVPFGIRKMDDKDVDKEEYERLERKITSLVYEMDAVTLRWGIPTITYVGNDPNPVKFGEHEKVYGAQVIRDIYIRLLATQQYKKFMKIIIVGVMALVGIMVVLFLLYLALKSNSNNLAVCLADLNSTKTQLVNCVNESARIMAQNRTLIIS